ncbi:MAG: hypothetical protein U0L02_06300 [Kandleria vitulina]|uniref:hypothetical protein n=1 Tax=Kandleria vitulina TaxID=1630 RepID=UPI002E7680C9|nr:hypothetical protein [Kandleria vitulina]MEE0988953.1 hypothetical protein [Kandleria vitulina]
MKRKIIVATLILSVFWAIVFMLGNKASVFDNRIKYIDGSTKTDINSGEIYKGEYVSQDFIAHYDNLYKLSLYFYEFSRDNAGDIFVQLIDVDSNKIIYNTVLNAENLNMNGRQDFFFQTQGHSKGKRYRVKVTSNSKKGKAVGLYVTLISERSEIPLKTSSTHLNDENEAYLREGKKELKKNGVKPYKDVSLKYKVNYDLSYKKENVMSSVYLKLFLVVLSYIVLFVLSFLKLRKCSVKK